MYSIITTLLKAPQPLTLNQICQQAGVSYWQAYRAIKRFEQQGIITIFKQGGLLFCAPSQRALDLIKREQNSNRCKKQHIGLMALPERARPQRIEAIKLCLKHRLLPAEVREDIGAKFLEYLDEIEDYRIFLRAKPTAPLNADLTKIFKYKIRFNDESKKKRNLKNYETAWDIASRQYKKAVFLTLTTDPKQQLSIWHGWRKFQKNWNRFITRMRKEKKQKLNYILINEFQKNGQLHAHIVIFGIPYLKNKDLISRIWAKYGQGKIVDIHSLQHNGLMWVWGRKKPKDSNGTQPSEYLKKYLKKAQYETEGMELYWASGKRFFSCSRIFSKHFEKPPAPLGWYYFIWAGTFMDMPLWALYIIQGVQVITSWEAKPPPTSLPTPQV